MKVFRPNSHLTLYTIVRRLTILSGTTAGYGLTETCATAMLGWIGDPASTTMIGPPRMCNEVKLLDVPAMNYTSNDSPNPRGEICIRGPNVFKRYFKGKIKRMMFWKSCAGKLIVVFIYPFPSDEKKTKEDLDVEGWFHTGDIAEVDCAGRFRIIDRIKVRTPSDD